jgi:hypothetical protein
MSPSNLCRRHNVASAYPNPVCALVASGVMSGGHVGVMHTACGFLVTVKSWPGAANLIVDDVAFTADTGALRPNPISARVLAR